MYSNELSEVFISEIEMSSCPIQYIPVTLLQTMYTYLQFFTMQHWHIFYSYNRVT